MRNFKLYIKLFEQQWNYIEYLYHYICISCIPFGLSLFDKNQVDILRIRLILASLRMYLEGMHRKEIEKSCFHRYLLCISYMPLIPLCFRMNLLDTLSMFVIQGEIKTARLDKGYMFFIPNCSEHYLMCNLSIDFFLLLESKFLHHTYCMKFVLSHSSTHLLYIGYKRLNQQMSKFILLGMLYSLFSQLRFSIIQGDIL
jgi:hypothetical protein